MSDLIVAIGLVLVIEGLLFAAFPATARRIAESALQTPDGPLRVAGVVSALIGVVIVWLIRG